MQKQKTNQIHKPLNNMNEYLSELYDWISSQDNTFQSRRSKEEFISKMQDDAEYNQQMYTWISSVDDTFTNRYTTDAFQTKTGLKKKRRISAYFSRGRYGIYYQGKKTAYLIGCFRRNT